MKKRMKLVCMVLTLAMLLGLLAGCGAGGILSGRWGITGSCSGGNGWGRGLCRRYGLFRGDACICPGFING